MNSEASRKIVVAGSMAAVAALVIVVLALRHHPAPLVAAAAPPPPPTADNVSPPPPPAAQAPEAAPPMPPVDSVASKSPPLLRLAPTHHPLPLGREPSRAPRQLRARAPANQAERSRPQTMCPQPARLLSIAPQMLTPRPRRQPRTVRPQTFKRRTLILTSPPQTIKLRPTSNLRSHSILSPRAARSE